MINTYDHKTEASFDLEGLGECMKSYIELEQNRKVEAMAKAEAYFNGYRDAIHCIASIMGASNYRVEEVEGE